MTNIVGEPVAMLRPEREYIVSVPPIATRGPPEIVRAATLAQA